MAFVQILTYSTTKRAEIDAAIEQWKDDTEDVRRSRRRLLLADRDVPDRYVEVVLFDSVEDAMHNSGLPATTVLSRVFEACAEDLTFQNLDLVSSELWSGTGARSTASSAFTLDVFETDEPYASVDGVD